MTSAASIDPSDFEQMVVQHYGFLIRDYGFSRKKLGDWLINFEVPNIRLSILVEHETLLSIAVEPKGEAAKRLLRQNILPKGISVIVVSMCLDPSLQYRITRLNANTIAHNIPIELRRQAELLEKYCSDILKGDFTEWAAIDACMSKRAYEFLNI